MAHYFFAKPPSSIVIIIHRSTSSMNSTSSRHDMSHISPLGLVIGRAVTGLLQFVLGAVGLGGNVVLAAGVLSHPPLRSKSTLLLASLAASDAGACLTSFLFGIRNCVLAGTGWAEVSVGVCFLSQDGPRMFFVFSGVVLILACALDRLLMMKRPIIYASIDTGRYVGGWAAATVAFAGGSVLVFGLSLQTEYTSLDFCDANFIYTLQLDRFITAVHVPLSFFIIFINILSIFFVKTVLQTNGQGKDAERRRRYQESLVLVLKVYTVSWLGMLGTASVENFGYPIEPGAPVRPVHFWVIAVVVVLFHLNNSSNFFIYYRRNAEFRRAFRVVLRLPNNEVGSVTLAMAAASGSAAVAAPAGCARRAF